MEGAIPVITGLNTELALEYSEKPEIFFALLGDFYSDIEKHCEIFYRAMREENIEVFAQEMHKLKSSSRMIGAVALSATAAELEHYAVESDWRSIRLRTPALIVQYRSYLPILEPYAKKQIEKTNSIDKEQLEKQCAELIDALNSFDLDGAQGVIDALSTCKLNDEQDAVFFALKSAVEEVEYDVAEELAQKLMEC